MRLVLTVEPDEVANIQRFVEQHRDNVLVRRRQSRNLNNSHPFPSREEIWEAIVACLLTTQQKSGPTNPVTRFLLTEPFPLSLAACQLEPVEDLALRSLTAHRGIRRFNMVAIELRAIYRYFERSGWEELEEHLKTVYDVRTADAERKAARFVDEQLHGFGPKQSRNLLQKLGLSRFEIPIDSRITKWLNENGFPIQLTSTALSDANYYEFVSDGVQQLCRACDVFPCVLDAAIFASYDNNGWNESNAIW